MFHLSNYIKTNKWVIALFIMIIPVNMGFTPNINSKVKESKSIWDFVNDSNENDKDYRLLLYKYIIRSMRSETVEDINQDSLKTLFSSNSFRSCILSICDTSSYIIADNIYETEDRWTENLPYLLSNCNIDSIKYNIADSLLLYRNGIGLIALWDSLEIDRLTNYHFFKKYLVRENNAYYLGEMAIIMHNSNNICEKNYFLDKTKRSNMSFYQFVKELLKDKKKVTYYDYLSSFENFENLE